MPLNPYKISLGPYQITLNFISNTLKIMCCHGTEAIAPQELSEANAAHHFFVMTSTRGQE